MAFDVLAPADNETALTTMTKVDNHLYLTGAATPQGVVIGRNVGQRYFCSGDNSHWVCSDTDGTVEGSVWSIVVIPNSVLDALSVL